MLRTVWLTVCLIGCSTFNIERHILPDAGTSDAGTSDAGTSDAGTSDAGTSDAGTSDAGTSDAGTSDAGTSDAGTSDAGTSDAGASDAGTSDAGTSDAGPTFSCPAGAIYCADGVPPGEVVCPGGSVTAVDGPTGSVAHFAPAAGDACYIKAPLQPFSSDYWFRARLRATTPPVNYFSAIWAMAHGQLNQHALALHPSENFFVSWSRNPETQGGGGNPSTLAIHPGVWECIEVHVVMGAAGPIEVFRNGRLEDVFNGAGLDTRPQGTLDEIYLGLLGGTTNVTLDFDEVVVSTTRVPCT